MDQIKVSGIEFWAHHGVLKSEQAQGQRFLVDCTLFLDSSLCREDLTRTVHYGEVALTVIHFCQSKKYQLIETLANELAVHLLLQYPLLEELELCVHKPNAPIPVTFSDVTLTVRRGWKTCYLGLGSNLGVREDYLDMVSLEIAQDAKVAELAKSAYLETEPYGVTDQPNFLNAALKIRTLYTPRQLLEFCQRLEAMAGRVKTRHWGERTLDVDILFYGDTITDTQALCIPHPQLHLRRFVLEPLCEIAPQLVHPIRRATVEALLAQLVGRE